MRDEYTVLLYYLYTKVEDPYLLRDQQHFFCLENNLRGRIVVASEGINGTLSGEKDDCDRYKAFLKSDPRFEFIEFKVEEASAHTFKKLQVKVKKEIANFGMPQVNPLVRTGKRLSPQAFLKMKQNSEAVLVDVRNHMEYKLGHFKNAISLGLERFRDFPSKVKALEPFRNKPVITFCTGGIRCEKATSYLLEKGFKEVYQLDGGIIAYKYAIENLEEFEGRCYVFDNRLSIAVNEKNPKIVSDCYGCQEPCERMINCANPVCNNHIPLCMACSKKYQGACSVNCSNHPQKRKYRGTGYYTREMNGYNPEKACLTASKRVKN